MLDLKNKTAIITGGGSGIGRAIAKLFAKQGATVHIIELNENAAKEVIEEIKKEKSEAQSHICNISDQKSVIEIFNKIDKIDILVNNAGIAHIGNVENTSEADFERVFNVNVRGVYNCLFAAVPLMKKHGGGVILNMSSIANHLGLSDRFAYSMSKGAVHAMTMTVAKDYIKDNIRCNSISPARVHTPFVDGFLEKNYPDNRDEMFEKLSKAQPIGRMGKPEEVANLALFLCSDAASFITGSDYLIDGGAVKLGS